MTLASKAEEELRENLENLVMLAHLEVSDIVVQMEKQVIKVNIITSNFSMATTYVYVIASISK